MISQEDVKNISIHEEEIMFKKSYIYTLNNSTILTNKAHINNKI